MSRDFRKTQPQDLRAGLAHAPEAGDRDRARLHGVVPVRDNRLAAGRCGHLFFCEPSRRTVASPPSHKAKAAPEIDPTPQTTEKQEDLRFFAPPLYPKTHQFCRGVRKCCVECRLLLRFWDLTMATFVAIGKNFGENIKMNLANTATT